MNSSWTKWEDVHESPDQQKRLMSARKAACTPLSVDPSTGSCTFSGSSGTHRTTLKSCSCTDFSRRKLPCKHMYRLAIDLGLLEGDAKSDSLLVSHRGEHISFERAVEIVESQPCDAQKALLCVLNVFRVNEPARLCILPRSSEAQSLLYAGLVVEAPIDEIQIKKYTKKDLLVMLSDRGISGYDKYMKRDDLYAWCLDNVPNIREICNGGDIGLVIPPAFYKCAARLRIYLDMKFSYQLNASGDKVCLSYSAPVSDFTFSFSAGPNGVSIGPGTETVRPSKYDEIISLLKKYGHDRVLNDHEFFQCV